MDILAPLQDHRFQAEGKELEGGEQPGWAGTHDDHGFCLGNVLVLCNLIRDVRFETVVVTFNPVTVDDIVPRIYGPAGYYAGGSRIWKGRLVGLGGIYHVNHGIAPQVHFLSGNDPYIVRPQFTAYTACHLKLYHVINN